VSRMGSGMNVNAATPFEREAGAGDISLGDLVSLHNKIKEAAGAFASAAKYSSGASDDRVLHALLREENELLDWRKEMLVREIRATIPRTRFEQILKLRFELNECGDDEIAAEAAVAEFQKCAFEPMDEEAEEETIELIADDDSSREERLADICDELFLAESAIQLLCRQRPELQGLRSLIARSIARLENLEDEPYPYGLAAE